MGAYTTRCTLNLLPSLPVGPPMMAVLLSPGSERAEGRDSQRTDNRLKAGSSPCRVHHRLLSVLRWIAKAIPQRNRWHPVFERYLKQIEVRVEALGGDPSKIYPSSTGDGGLPEHEPHGPFIESTGKIAGLLFDRFGDFEGFLLETDKGERKFHSRETEMMALAERAWRERLRLTVCADRDEPHRPISIVVRKPPAPFGL